MKLENVLPKKPLPWILGFSVSAAVLIGCGGSGSGSSTSTATGGGITPKNSFVQTSLVADSAAGGAQKIDPHMVNPWGVSFAPGGPFWVSDNATGLSTLYDGSGNIQSLVVTIPSASGSGVARVTGQVYNGTNSFTIPGVGPSQFIFVNSDGVMSAWYAGATAVKVSDQSTSGASYDGLAIASSSAGNFLYAANFFSGMIDMFDTNFALHSSFTDPGLPAGYAPFNVQNIGGLLYVTFAVQDPTKHRDVPGAGNGIVDVFNPDGSMKQRLVTNGLLNSPWGLAQAPSNFGAFSNALLVANLGDGHINAYNITTGVALGTLNTAAGTPVTIPGLWAIVFGTSGTGSAANALYFTAGPNSYGSGLFGTLTPLP